ncbi:MAG: EVE domain-containing protein, partial [Nitrospinales bacterium]
SDSRWVVVNLKPVKSMKNPVTLEDVKSNPKLKDIALVKQSRLSVMPLAKNEFQTILKMGNTTVKGL